MFKTFKYTDNCRNGTRTDTEGLERSFPRIFSDLLNGPPIFQLTDVTLDPGQLRPKPFNTKIRIPFNLPEYLFNLLLHITHNFYAAILISRSAFLLLLSSILVPK